MSETASTLLDSYRELLLRYTDPMDIGWRKQGSDVVMARRNNKTLTKNKNGEGRADALSVDLLQDHLARRQPIHTHPARGQGRVWFLVDIDAHEGQTDAQSVADLILSLFPQSYYETSTNDRGIHMYVWVKQFRDVSRYNSVVATCEQLLRRLVRAKGLCSTVELKHTFTIFNASNEVTKRGLMAKAPFLPDGPASLEQFMSAPCWPLPSVTTALREALREAGGDPKIPRKPGAGGATKTNKKAATSLSSPTNHSCQSSLRVFTVPASRQITASQRITHIREPEWDDNSFVRMQRACAHYIQTRKRVPDVNELLDHYEQAYQRDGTDPHRARRARDVVKHATNFWHGNNGSYRCYDREHYMRLAVSVPQIPRAAGSSKYACKIDDEDLAIAIYCLERASFTIKENPKDQYSFGERSIQMMFKKLREAGETKRGCNNHKDAAIRAILVSAEWMKYIDTGYVPGYTAKKAGIGPAHPLYSRLLEMQHVIPPVTAKSFHRQWHRQEQERTEELSRQVQAELAESLKGHPSAPATSQVRRVPPRPDRKVTRRKGDPPIDELRAQFSTRRRYANNTPDDEETLLRRYRAYQTRQAHQRRAASAKEMRRLTREILLEKGILQAGQFLSQVPKDQIRAAAREARQRVLQGGLRPGMPLPSETYLKGVEPMRGQ